MSWKFWPQTCTKCCVGAQRWILSAGLLSSQAGACPLCHSNTAEEVRAGILATAQDGTVLAALLGPFVAMGILLIFFERWGGDHER
jgi:hypothetical protein